MTTPNPTLPNPELYIDHEAKNQPYTPPKARFSLLVQSAHTLSDARGIAVYGFVHGKINRGEKVYIIDPQGNVYTAAVSAIKVEETKTVSSAKNQQVQLHIDHLNDNPAPGKLAVLSSHAPLSELSATTIPANYYLKGLLNDYTLLHQDPYYVGILIYALCHAHYLVPVEVANAPLNVQNVPENVAKSVNITFLSLKNQEGTRSDFPLFTDMDAFSQWKKVLGVKTLPKTMTVKFSHIASFTAQNKDGLLIDPFGPMSFPMPYDFVQKITDLPEYKQEFAPGDEAEPPTEDQSAK